MKQIKAQYGFPLFVKDTSTDYLLKAEKIRVSDIWPLWHYIIKSEKKRYPGKTDYPFLLSVLEQAQYFYEAASLAPIKSKPLLYYYSFLNIAKAAIVLTNPELLTSLEFNHGINTCPINSRIQLQNCSITVKSLINNNGTKKKISVAYELAQLFGDNVEVKIPYHVKHDNGPWAIDIISLLKSCIGIHRTVSETFKMKESFVRLESPVIEKEGKVLTYKGIINCAPDKRPLLAAAGYNIEEINQKWYLKEEYNMPTQNLSRSIFKSFQKKCHQKDYGLIQQEMNTDCT